MKGENIMKFENLKHMLCKELKEFDEQKESVTESSLMLIWRLSDTIKNLVKIEVMNENGSHSYGMSHDEEMMYSERRGRGANAKRDSMGRYSRDSYDSSYKGGYSEHRYPDGDGRVGGNAYNYSRSNGKEHMMNQLGHMMHDADDEERKILEKCMNDLNRV